MNIYDFLPVREMVNEKTDFEYTWNDVIKFWSKFTDGVKQYHPDAYIAAEVTDINDIYSKGKGDKSGTRYSNPQEAVQVAQVRPSKIALASPSLKSFFLCTRKPSAKHATKTRKKIKETK